MIDLKVKLTKEQRATATDALANQKVLTEVLVKARNQLDLVGQKALLNRLVVMELEGQRRMSILERLIARFSRLEAMENQATVMAAAAAGQS